MSAITQSIWSRVHQRALLPVMRLGIGALSMSIAVAVWAGAAPVARSALVGPNASHLARPRSPHPQDIAHRSAHKRSRPVGAAGRLLPALAVLPGFEILSDGSTRLFVELSKTVAYEVKPSDRELAYVLKDTVVHRRNNTNPLVTVDFNTPVRSARLVPHGHDLWFVVALRAKAEPVVTMDPSPKDAGRAVLHIAFAAGAYGPPKDAVAPAPSKPD